MDYLIEAIPIFLLFIGIEYIISKQQKRDIYNLPDFMTNISCGTLYSLLYVLSISFTGITYLYVYDNIALFHIQESVLSWIVAFIGVDFFYYCYHRACHRSAFFWATHVVHHQSEEFNLSVALRQSALSYLYSWIFYLPLALLGFSPKMFFISFFINFVYQFYIHCNLINKLGIFESIFNTPSHHRVHHGKNERYLDKNYAGVFIIWDKWLGTFQQEDEQAHYGIVHPLRSWNPYWANIHAWVEMYQSCIRTHSLIEKIKIIFYPPGYNQAIEQSSTTMTSNTPQTKFSVNLDKKTTYYLFIHFLILNLIMLYFYSNLTHFSHLEKYIYAFFIALSLWTFYGYFSEKKWVHYVEYGRLLYGLGGMLYFLIG